MANGFPWTCPYCNRATTITSENITTGAPTFNDGNKDGLLALSWNVVTCPNPACKEYEIWAKLYKATHTPNTRTIGEPLLEWQLRPQSSARSFPDYIPKPVLDDYAEACLIRDLSPKASATLSRRCLQGIIRDYWKISKNRLIDEINEIKDKVDLQTWNAIDAIRRIGNIGAHMESDINLLVEVEPHEAQLLIGLIEILLKDWYVARHDREEHLRSIVALATDKASARKGSAG